MQEGEAEEQRQRQEREEGKAAQKDKESEAEPEGEVPLRGSEHRNSAVAERTGARIGGVCSVKGQVETWLVDSGATSHVLTRSSAQV